jgi:hypothetical protein
MEEFLTNAVRHFSVVRGSGCSGALNRFALARCEAERAGSDKAYKRNECAELVVSG